jgi:two-component system response regulator FixJ
MNPNTQISLIDDDPALLDALSFQLDAAGFHVTAYTSVAEFLIDYQQCVPDCIICDYQMPGFSGMDLLRRFDTLGLSCPFLMLSAVGTIELAVEATKSGSFNFLQKGQPAEILIAAIQAALSSRPEVSAEQRAAQALIDTLTPREKEVFIQVTDGQSSKLIARKLDASPRTIDAHRANLIRKLGIQSPVQMLELRLKAGY